MQNTNTSKYQNIPTHQQYVKIPNTKILKHQNPKIPKHQDINISKFQNNKPPTELESKRKNSDETTVYTVKVFSKLLHAFHNSRSPNFRTFGSFGLHEFGSFDLHEFGSFDLLHCLTSKRLKC